MSNNHRFFFLAAVCIPLNEITRFICTFLSLSGLYPLVGWKIGGETVYLAEGNAAGCGSAMEWAGKMGTYFLPFLTYSPPLLLTFCVFVFLSLVLLIVRIIFPMYLIAR